MTSVTKVTSRKIRQGTFSEKAAQVFREGGRVPPAPARASGAHSPACMPPGCPGQANGALCVEGAQVTDPAPFPESQPLPTNCWPEVLSCYPCLLGPLSHARAPTPLPASSLLSLLTLRTHTHCIPSPTLRDIQHAPTSQLGQLLEPEGGPCVCTVVQGEFRCRGHPFSSPRPRPASLDITLSLLSGLPVQKGPSSSSSPAWWSLRPRAAPLTAQSGHRGRAGGEEAVLRHPEGNTERSLVLAGTTG